MGVCVSRKKVGVVKMEIYVDIGKGAVEVNTPKARF